MSEKEWTIGNIIALAERFGTCIHRNIQAAYYHGEIDVREREKEESNKNEIEARTELEQAVSNIFDERDQLRAENDQLRAENERLCAENERLREGLVDIKTRILDEHYKEAIQIIDRIAREVTK